MDCWALGVVLFIMLTGYHPFDREGVRRARLSQRVRARGSLRPWLARHSDPMRTRPSRDVPMPYARQVLTDADARTLRQRICDEEPDFTEWSASAEARRLVSSLLRKDPDERLTIEQLLQHPWLLSGGIGEADTLRERLLGSPAARARDARHRQFRALTSKLRTAVFAVVLQQQAAERHEAAAAQAAAAQSAVGRQRRRASRVQRHGSQRANMLETDLLTKAFRAFDKEGKGFITEADLRRVLTSDLGERGVAGGELRAWLEGAAEYDREGRRVTYGSFVRMMNHTARPAE